MTIIRKACLFAAVIGAIGTQQLSAGCVIKFSTLGQQYGVADLDHFQLSTSPDTTGIFFEQRCEYPDSNTVGTMIWRSNAMNDLVWGQFGCEGSYPWPTKPGSVWYYEVPGVGVNYIRIRYSKHSGAATSIEILVNDDHQTGFIPADQGSWNDFEWTGWFAIELPDAVPPDVINDLTAVRAADDNLLLSWSEPADNVGVVGYRVYQSNAAFGVWNLLVYLGSYPTAYTVEGVCGNPTTNYFFTVRGIDAADNLAGMSNIVGEFDFSSSTRH